MSVLLARRGGNAGPKKYGTWTEVDRNLAWDPDAATTAAFQVNGMGALSTVAGWDGFPNAIRFTRTATGAARFGVACTWSTSSQVTIRLLVRSSAALPAMAYSLRRAIDDGTGAVTLAGAVAVAAGTSIVTYTGNTPSTGPGGSVPSGVTLVWTTGGAIGQTIDLAGIQVEYGPTLQNHFSGDTPDTLLEQFSWSGAQFLSPSIKETRLLLPA